MLLILLALSATASIASAPPLQAPAAAAIDVSAIKVGAPTTIAELDLGKLKGDLRQIGWSPDAKKLYVQTVDGAPQSPKLHHYWVAIEGGAVLGLDAQPDWAEQYWAFKSDRSAPGIGSLMIDLEQKFETVKVGTGTAGAVEGGDRAGGGTVMSGANLDREAQNQKQNVLRLTLLGEAVSEFVNERPIPGLMFGWGPEKSGAIAYTNREGRLMLLDQAKHKQTVSGAKDALLPAWTTDGSRLAWVQKSGRRKYTLVYATVSR